jgi:prevent-host-death family protein
MLTVNMHEAKTHWSSLLDRTAKGEPFIIAKAGKPLVKVVPLDAPEPNQPRRLGFMAGQIEIPDDFDRMGSSEIEQLFGSRPRACCWIRICCCRRPGNPSACRSPPVGLIEDTRSRRSRASC